MKVLRRRITLAASDVIAQAGNDAHAGSGYNKMNTRLHCFLEDLGSVRRNEQGHFSTEELEELNKMESKTITAEEAIEEFRTVNAEIWMRAKEYWKDILKKEGRLGKKGQIKKVNIATKFTLAKIQHEGEEEDREREEEEAREVAARKKQKKRQRTKRKSETESEKTKKKRKREKEGEAGSETQSRKQREIRIKKKHIGPSMKVSTEQKKELGKREKRDTNKEGNTRKKHKKEDSREKTDTGKREKKHKAVTQGDEQQREIEVLSVSSDSETEEDTPVVDTVERSKGTKRIQTKERHSSKNKEGTPH